jgi:hypothetical protein
MQSLSPGCCHGYLQQLHVPAVRRPDNSMFRHYRWLLETAYVRARQV